MGRARAILCGMRGGRVVPVAQVYISIFCSLALQVIRGPHKSSRHCGLEGRLFVPEMAAASEYEVDPPVVGASIDSELDEARLLACKQRTMRRARHFQPRPAGALLWLFLSPAPRASWINAPACASLARLVGGLKA